MKFDLLFTYVTQILGIDRLDLKFKITSQERLNNEKQTSNYFL
jgi:hypothetical protein